METDDEVEYGKVFRPWFLLTCDDFGHLKIFQILVIGYHINWKSRAFKVMLPSF